MFNLHSNIIYTFNLKMKAIVVMNNLSLIAQDYVTYSFLKNKFCLSTMLYYGYVRKRKSEKTVGYLMHYEKITVTGTQ